jgi:hypothetical protein
MIQQAAPDLVIAEVEAMLSGWRRVRKRRRPIEACGGRLLSTRVLRDQGRP